SYGLRFTSIGPKHRSGGPARLRRYQECHPRKITTHRSAAALSIAELAPVTIATDCVTTLLRPCRVAKALAVRRVSRGFPARTAELRSVPAACHHPQMPALMVTHHRPGFYFRVIQEGDVGAGDQIEKVAAGPESLTVADIDALLYSGEHPIEMLRKALK